MLRRHVGQSQIDAARFMRNRRPGCGCLAIEVIRKSGSIDALDIYRKLRVREVWIWRKGAIDV